MAEQIFPTKGNLIKSKRQLKQAQLGYELMDRKRRTRQRNCAAVSTTHIPRRTRRFSMRILRSE